MIIEEKFPACPICGETITSDASLVTKHCRLCGMPTKSKDKFCCRKCEGKYKRYIEKKWNEKRWRHERNN